MSENTAARPQGKTAGKAAGKNAAPKTETEPEGLSAASFQNQAWDGPDLDAPIFVISVAAKMAGMHPQTLRQYDRLALVRPQRTRGGGRRYSPRDLIKLEYVQRLSQDMGVNLAGIRLILELGDTVAALQREVEELRQGLQSSTLSKGRVFMADGSGRVSQRSTTRRRADASQAAEAGETAPRAMRQLPATRSTATRADLVLWGGSRTTPVRVTSRSKTVVRKTKISSW